jgi:hypothetical protein
MTPDARKQLAHLAATKVFSRIAALQEIVAELRSFGLNAEATVLERRLGDLSEWVQKHRS